MTADAVVQAGAVVIDVSDLRRSAAFWGALLAVDPGQPRNNGDYVTVGPLADGVWLVLQRVSENKTTKNRVHVDFTVADADAAISLIVAFGGSQVSKPRAGGGVTMADPDGNEFCIGMFRRDRAGRTVPR